MMDSMEDIRVASSWNRVRRSSANLLNFETCSSKEGFGVTVTGVVMGLGAVVGTVVLIVGFGSLRRVVVVSIGFPFSSRTFAFSVAEDDLKGGEVSSKVAPPTSLGSPAGSFVLDIWKDTSD